MVREEINLPFKINYYRWLCYFRLYGKFSWFEKISISLKKLPIIDGLAILGWMANSRGPRRIQFATQNYQLRVVLTISSWMVNSRGPRRIPHPHLNSRGPREIHYLLVVRKKFNSLLKLPFRSSFENFKLDGNSRGSRKIHFNS